MWKTLCAIEFWQTDCSSFPRSRDPSARHHWSGEIPIFGLLNHFQSVAGSFVLSAPLSTASFAQGIATLPIPNSRCPRVGGAQSFKCKLCTLMCSLACWCFWVLFWSHIDMSPLQQFRQNYDCFLDLDPNIVLLFHILKHHNIMSRRAFSWW